MKPLFENGPVLRLVAGLLMVGAGGAALGIGASFQGAEGPGITAYVYAMTIAGVEVGSWPSQLQGALIGGVIGLVGGLIALVTGTSVLSSKVSRFVFLFSLLLGLVGGCISLAGGLGIGSSDFIKMFPDVYLFNLARQVKGQLPPRDTRLHLWTMAVSEVCCYDRGWFAQTKFAACDVPCPSPQSGHLTDPRIDIVRNTVNTNDFCTCTPPAEEAAFAQMKAQLTPEICASLNKIGARFQEDVKIPTSPVTLGVARSQLFPGEEIIRVPLVGYHLAYSLDPEGLTKPGYGFGCGIGYPKGMIWMQELYWLQFIAPYGQSMMIIGVVQVIAVVVILLIGVLAALSDDADHPVDQRVMDWNDPNKGNALATPAEPALPAYAASSGPPVAAYQATDYSADLREFYKIYDPSKTENDVKAINNWAMSKGGAALNTKLREKYHADLSTIRQAKPPI